MSIGKSGVCLPHHSLKFKKFIEKANLAIIDLRRIRRYYEQVSDSSRIS